MSQNTEQRRASILSGLYENGRVAVKDLAGALGVSEATVRRDLKALAEADKLELVFGGAALPRISDFSFRSKGMRDVEAKKIIGRLAAEFVHDNDLIFVDSGTTCFQMTPHLKARRNVSIIVNSARLALELDAPHLEVILLGGQYRPERMDTVGPMTAAALDQLRGFTAFIGADGLSRDFGLTAADIESAHVFGLAMKHARQSILLVDHRKFLSPSLFRIDGFEYVGRVITDRPPAREWRDFFEENGIELTCPQEE
jgi:DeoR/GlpR family transcriptional regulator of sugar metabolism